MPLKKAVQNLRPVEIVAVVYLLITGIFILFFYSKIEDAHLHLLFRIGGIGSFFLIDFIYRKKNNAVIKFIRAFYILTLLSFFYAETDAFNNVFFPYLDPVFASWENQLFNGQPSVAFYQAFPNRLFNEVMNFAYFCFFPLIVILCVKLYYTNAKAFANSYFLLCTSFFLYYIIFAVLPVAGPQFYFTAPFNHNPPGYVFSKIMHTINTMAERPTAAFPSSHVGITVILWYLCFKYARNLLYFYIPIGILLILSTVYIKAHYLIDIFAGIISAPIIYFISLQLQKLVYKLSPKN